MSRAPIGARVFALRSADDSTVFLYGHGVYAGMQPEPHWDPDSEFLDGQTWRESTQEQVRAQMAQPQEEYIRDGQPTGMDVYGVPMGDTRTFDQRVEDTLIGIGSNPRIDLDSGGSVWGFFCWWALEDRFESVVAGRDVVVVPVPDPLPHSLKTAPR